MSKSKLPTTAMTRLVVPPHMSTSVSVEGFELEADEDRTIEVPEKIAAVLRSHGLKDWTPPPPQAGAKVGSVTGR